MRIPKIKFKALFYLNFFNFIALSNKFKFFKKKKIKAIKKINEIYAASCFFNKRKCVSRVRS